MRGLVSNTSAVEAPHKNVNLELRPYIGGCPAHARYSVGERGRGHRDRGLPEQMLDQLVAKPSVHLLIALVAWYINLPLNRLLSVVHRNYSGWVEFDTVNGPEKRLDGL